MRELGWGKHALILGALILNLWVGGDLVELWLGGGARGVFEIGLIVGYLTLIVGLRFPEIWRDRFKRARPAARPEERGDRDHEGWRGL